MHTGLSNFEDSYALLGGVSRPKPAVTLPLSARLVDEGDSITAGSSGPTYMMFAQAGCGGRFYQSNPMHTAQAGRTASDAVGRISTINALNPAVVSLMIGTNTLGAGISGATTWGLIKQCLIGYLNGSATYVVLYPILPRVAGAFAWTAGNETERLALNVLIANFAIDPDLARYVNNIKVVPNLDATFDPTSGVDTVDGLHPSWSGAGKVGAAGGPVLASIISTSDIAGLYTDASNLLLATNNPQLTGTTGTKSAASGVVATGWTLAGGSTMGNAGAKTTLNGATAQQFVLSGSNANANQLVRFYCSYPGTLNVGEAYEAWVDILVASGSAFLQRVYLQFSPYSASFNANRTEVSVPAFSGVIRTLPQLIAVQQVTPLFQIDLNMSVGTVAADITIGRPFARQVTSL